MIPHFEKQVNLFYIIFFNFKATLKLKGLPISDRRWPEILAVFFLSFEAESIQVKHFHILSPCVFKQLKEGEMNKFADELPEEKAM